MANRTPRMAIKNIAPLQRSARRREKEREKRRAAQSGREKSCQTASRKATRVRTSPLRVVTARENRREATSLAKSRRCLPAPEVGRSNVTETLGVPDMLVTLRLSIAVTRRTASITAPTAVLIVRAHGAAASAGRAIALAATLRIMGAMQTRRGRAEVLSLTTRDGLRRKVGQVPAQVQMHVCAILPNVAEQNRPRSCRVEIQALTAVPSW